MIKIVGINNCRLDASEFTVELDKEYTVRDLIKEILIFDPSVSHGIIDVNYGDGFDTRCSFSHGILTTRIPIPIVNDMIVDVAEMTHYFRTGSYVYTIYTRQGGE